MTPFRLTVNGTERTVSVEPDTPLLWVLRDTLGLLGTKYGCGMGACGACTVHQGSRAVRSCQIPISEAAGRAFTTIEGLSVDGRHPVQRAWLKEDVSQCGFCQAGMMMAAAALLRGNESPTDKDIDRAMADLLCRCGTYQRILKAVHVAAKESGRVR